MQRVTLYSSSRRASAEPVAAGDATPAAATPAAAAADPAAAPGVRPSANAPPVARWRRWLARHERLLLVVVSSLATLAAFVGYQATTPVPRRITQQDIEAAVLQVVETTPLPSYAARAYEVIRPSVVRVRGFGTGRDGVENTETGVGTGVVIVDNGLILTNLHVVSGADRIGVVFADGLEADADVVGVQPEHDLAVIRAKKIPDDLVAATLRSTAGLAPGDHVVAVGFPFGIGPSASAGVISGLAREHQSPRGKRLLTNLIQFDAAANPGNSGGPLVTAEGEVIGIVTGILNPNQQRTFIGIGFAVPIENAAAGVGLSPF
ncbi:MAG: trypsin-like peptidase domain-containing protein [Betaproteobacteria bacterium]|nr:trypsin-like peptidase domain-containing protein [Betaproteobacteria bacterium]